MTGHWIVRSDGGARGNPGPAGAGFVVEDPSGRMVRSGGVFLGTTTNNKAEYEAVIAGLSAALEAGAAAVQLRADSELVVRQLRGLYRVKNPGLRPLHHRACELLARFTSSDVVHVRREENEVADSLANAAIDSRGAVGDARVDHGPVTLP